MKTKMQACSGAAVMGSLQQPIWVKGSRFPSEGSVMVGFPNQIRLNMVKACRCSSIEGSLVTGRPPSSVSVPIPEIGGKIFFNTLVLENFLLVNWCLRLVA